MKLTHLYYRAFRTLRKETKHNTDSETNRRLIANASQESDFFSVTRVECKIDEEWVRNIEEGLIYVEKAIREERQFIRSQGEVVPIEKVKRVSKASIEHLAKHSNLITRVPKNRGEGLIPEKLYMVEKLTDYHVYENRFIYMLLTYLKDFIQIRLDQIKDKITTYYAEMSLDKHIDENKRKINYNLSFDEKRENDPFLIEKYHNMPMINRVENAFAVTQSLLLTPLMKELAKAPKVKPPIVKTNALRMNPNFRMALNLYEYIMSYNKDGYELFDVKDTFQPLPTLFGDRIAELVQLNSVLTYLETEGREDSFEKQYQVEQKTIQEQIDLQEKEELRILKKRVQEMSIDPAEYILKLEKRNLSLEQDRYKLKLQKERNEELFKTIEMMKLREDDLMDEIHDLKKDVSQRDTRIMDLKQKNIDDMMFAEKVHQKELEDLEAYYEGEIRKVKLETQQVIKEMEELHQKKLIQKDELLQEKLAELQQLFEEEKNIINVEHNKKLEDTITTYSNELSSLMESTRKEIDELKQSNEQWNHQNDELTGKYNTCIGESKEQEKTLNEAIQLLEAEKNYANAKYIALKAQQGLIAEDDKVLTKEQFKQLESERSAYKKHFKEQWKKAKLRIRENARNKVFHEEKNNEKDE